MEAVYYNLEDEGTVPDEYLTEGYYFHAYNHDFAIVVDECVDGQNCKMRIFSIGILQDDRVLENLQLVKFLEYSSTEHEYTMNVWGKYYFIKYEELHPSGYQLSHGYNEIEAQSAVLKAALEFGIKKAKITLY